MYDYREMTPEQRREIVENRRRQQRPWHSPPHWDFEGQHQFIISATCFEHAPVIGKTPERMTDCEAALLKLCEEYATVLYGWCLLPNHYHLLLRTEQLKELRAEIGRFHGRSSFNWNREDESRGRKVWHNCFDREIQSHRHFWASVNYIHHNPVKHGYAQKWQDWPWSSAAEFLERVGRETAEKIWREFPILDYGKKWDVD
ncbi:MAG TPA: transposase [Blastocatellia bacterium]|nr:transposase [Blastocatellia bacterium]